MAKAKAKMGRTDAANPVIKDIAKVFRLLSNETRLKLILALAEGDLCVNDLCKKLGLSQPMASHHLGLLRMSSLVHDTRAGKMVIYSLNRPLWNEIGTKFFVNLQSKGGMPAIGDLGAPVRLRRRTAQA
ncbi:MAG: winged helix-turn-helix transcriptional regulator [Myxococcales bacterium]|nr:winged helix-turn-helix transcriptional regulator [Myxococcales bacterium]